ncbi:permease-like cell division protein FtsX [Oceanimonas sp. NS1]|uniref:Cell division protein FtsX n=1 Tax=Oceanimonas doudoroffii TaxID=84158 RepID=A0A233RDE0_9GAMM|nr:permease-like cell division protein FtsX [Oceanimonas doudoroffii]MCT7654404.1 permease-like cell division protein FtsX [Oceanimonas sp. NS1]OXY81382.1 cell division protein FtsX [Oceanimonas doudoroffii]
MSGTHKLTWHQRLVMYWVDHLRQLFASLGELWRTPLSSLMTIAVLGVSLALPASFYVLLKNAESVSSFWQSQAQISLYLKQNSAEDQVKAFQTRLEGMSEIYKVTYISPEQGLSDFSGAAGFAEALDLLEQNPLPAVLILNLSESGRQPDMAELLLADMNAEPLVATARLDMAWLARLSGIVELMRQAVVGMAVLLLAGVLLVVSNTLRLNILSCRYEIEVMKLVGATDGFIHRPFLYVGLWYGIIGGLLAWWLTLIMVFWLSHKVSALAALYQSDFTLLGLGLNESLLLVLTGTLLSLLASGFSVRRHIRAIEPA